MAKSSKNISTSSKSKKKDYFSSMSEISDSNEDITEGSLSESSEEEMPTKKGKKKVVQGDSEGEAIRKRISPSKKSGKKMDLAALIRKGRSAPVLNEDGKNINDLKPDRPSNIIWVVKTEKVKPPVIDPTLITNLEPRFLTPEEINYIVDVIPMVPAAIAEVGCIVQQQIKNVLTTQLMREQIIPLGINVLRAEIEYHFYRGLVEPGKTIGLTTAETIGEPLTQLTLSSFHNTGSAKAGVSDINSIGELFNVSQQRKNEYTTIHFADKYLTYDDVLVMRSKITSVTLQDLVKNTTNITILDEVPPHDRGWWYSMTEKMYGLDMGEDSVFVQGKIYLRLVLDKQQLYNLDLKIGEVARMITGKDETEVFKCVVSPSSVGVIDIYPTSSIGSVLRGNFKKNRVKQSAYRALTEESMEVVFLQKCIVNKMSEIIIRGVPGLKDINPVSIRIIILLKYAEKMCKRQKDLNHGIYYHMSAEEKDFLSTNMKKLKLDGNPENLWKIWIDDIQARTSGVPIERLVKLLEFFGYKVIYSPPDIEEEVYHSRKLSNPVYGQLRSDGIIIYYDGEDDPLEIMKSKINAAKKGTDEESKEILKLSEYIYATASGINMEALLYNPFIDPARTKCNNLYAMMEVYGIEVTRNAYIREFYEHIINNGQQMNPKYLILVAEFVTNQGFLVPVTSRGVGRHNVGPFAKASIDQAFLTIVDAAFFKKKEQASTSTSTAIFTGKRPIIGTGMCQPIPDEDMLRENKILEDERMKKVLEKDLEPINLDNIKDMDFAKSTQLNLEPDAEDVFTKLKSIITNVSKPETKEYDIWEKGTVPPLIINQGKLPDLIRDICDGVKKKKLAKIVIADS